MYREQALELIGSHITDYVNIDQIDTLTDNELGEIIEELKDWGKIQG
jgi:hypothetical protein